MRFIIVLLNIMAFAGFAMAQPTLTELRQTDGNWQLFRDGKPYFILGAGGDASKERLRQVGANSFRTWNTENLDVQLDEAHRLGLSVTVGIWLQHERHGFSYADDVMVKRQFESVIEVVQRYKDHPAVLIWAIGNETEGFKAGDNPAIWKAINDIAKEVKRIDPNHPTMTVTAEIGGKRVESLRQFCPDIDIVGINSYGGAPTLAKRYRKANGEKPYIITEFGTRGSWDVKTTAWKAPIEPTSTEKAKQLTEAYKTSILSEKDRLCLGSYAFFWGWKQEATATWFGLLLPDGSRLESVDVLSEFWTGQRPGNHCPTIESLTVDGSTTAKPGETIRVKLSASDPEKDALTVKWELHKDLEQYQFGGDFQAPPPSFPEAIISGNLNGAEVRLPTEGGGYFLYAYVRDSNGGAAVANVPLFVDAPLPDYTPPQVKLPFIIYGDDQPSPPYVPSGFFGDHKGIKLDLKSTDQPHAGKTCLKFFYKSRVVPSGVIWQHPANDMGSLPGGYNITGATKLSFWVRGEKGTERAYFTLGVIFDKTKKFHDTAFARTGEVELGKEWKQYEIDLKGKDLSRIKTAFGIVMGSGNPDGVTIYIDDVQYE